jgi:single-stranded-DNA-specific exonuclease
MNIVQRHTEQMLDLQEWQDTHPVLRRIYAARGVQHKADIEYELKNLLPFDKLKNISQAAELLFEALQQQWRILIIGDFDADGATSSALAVRALRAFGVQHVDYLVPNRFTYGYGLTPEIVAVAAEKKPNLIITVDNGISSIAGVEAAKKLGIKVLITDHHIAGDALPEAEAIVNPNQRDDAFESKAIAGVGVIFYVLLALRRCLREKNYFSEKNIVEPNMAAYLDLVALGTVADVVSLDRNNRILVKQGLRRIQAGKCCPGISALLQISKRDAKKISAADLGFALGPRLNAAGRLEDMSLGIECLLTDSNEQALAYAQQLDALNHERRGIESDMSEQAFAILKKMDFKELPVGLCVFDQSWHQGVIGILASRIKDKYHRPVIAFAPAEQGIIKGSARSIVGIHIRDMLDAIAKKQPTLLTKFGGHAMAAGLSLAQKDFAAFNQAFIDEIAQHCNPEELRGAVYSDGTLRNEELNLELAEQLQAGGPWGQHFAEPAFDGIFSIVEQRLVGQKHLKLLLKQSDKIFSAIAFNVDLTQWPNYRAESIHVVYRLDINEYQGRSSLQLIIEHISLQNSKDDL